MDNITLKSLSQSTLALLFAAGISTAAVASDHDVAGMAPQGGEAKIEAPKTELNTAAKVEGGEVKGDVGKIEEKKEIKEIPATVPVQPIK